MLRTTQVAAVVSISFLLGCTAEPVTGPDSDTLRPKNSVIKPEPSVGDPLAVLAKELPEFGGLFLPEWYSAPDPRGSGAVNVYVTASGRNDVVQRVVLAFLANRGIDVTSVRILPGLYRYSELLEWKGVLKDALAIPGVVSLDLDETKNDLVVGLSNPQVESSVRKYLTTTDVPVAAVRVRVVEPIRRAITLQDSIRPIEAGQQIDFSNYSCSLGFNASLAGSFLFAADSEKTFVTASHCTDTQGGVENTSYYQGGGFIGTELRDPTYFSGGACPSGRYCRYSDAAMVQYDQGTSWDPAAVARTSSGITISTVQPSVIIYDEQVAVVNSIVGRIGRTSGCTSGSVTGTCIDANVSGSNITQLCQVKVHAFIDYGDSGGPAITYYELYPGVPNSAWGADLYGIAWGKVGDTDFFYSPISAVHSELGTFDAVCASPWFC